MTLADDVRLLCTVIDSGNYHGISWRIKLQEITYFCRYYGSNMRDYKPHYYVPFSFNLAGLVGAGCEAGMMDEGDGAARFHPHGQGRGIFSQGDKQPMLDRISRLANLKTMFGEIRNGRTLLASTLEKIKTSR